ncbi:MAG: HAMP domain-containing protein, partial [Deltaproteobacteria bacterium]|nr:HAMP domain-containing protein [Deltaproteobacteria bacterium]
MAEAPPGCCRTGASVCSHGDGDGDGVDRRTFVPEAAGRDRRARSEHGPATAGVPRGYRRGVRFRISLLLLLSALNLAALGAVLFVLLTPGALRDLLPEQIRTWHALHTVETLHQQLLVDAVRAGRTKERLAFPGEGFDHMEQVLVELLEEGYADLQPQLHDFRKAARLWYELGLPVPRDYQTVFPELQELAAPLQESDPPEQASGRAEDAGLSTPSTSPPAMEQEAPTMPAPADEPPAPSPGGPPSAARTNGGGGSEPPGPSLPAAVGQWAFDEVEGSYRQFRTMLTTLAASRLNRSPQLVRTAVGWLIMWSFLTALLYIYAARRLRTLISVPLEQLTEAAVAIGRGELRTPVAVPLRDDELGALGRAIEEMRDGLFRYVDQLREHGQR